MENENRSLLRELDQLRSRQDTSLPLAARPALAEISANTKLDALATGASEYDSEKAIDWKKKFSKLAARHASLEQRQEETHRLARRFRLERDDWVKYAQSLEGKIAKLEKKVQRNKNADEQLPPSSSAKPRPAPANQTGAFSDRAVLDSSIVAKPEQAIDPRSRGDPAQDPRDSKEVAPAPGTSLPGYAGPLDEETQDGSDGADDLPLPQGTPPGSAVRIKEETSSDAPVIVSERTIRKRKHTDDEVGMPASPRRIKTEQSSSSEPIITGEAPIFCPHESIDLDEEEREMPTPRKQQEWESRHILREDKDVAPIEERLVEAPSIEKRVYTSTRGSDSYLDRSATAALSPRKPSRTHKDRERPIRAGWTLDSGIADVAEETFESFYALKPRQVGNGSHETPTHGRLHSLLNDNSPKKSGAFLPPARLRHGSASPCFDKENIENMAAEETEKRSGALVKPAPIVNAPKATPLRRHDKGNPSKPGRLRDRPPAGLRPEDFKVNPRSNNGFKHAFDEVVRSREERAELSGCTDPNCCGRQFRAMAESELSAGGLGILSRVADIKMMEDYLGTEAYQLVEMTGEERQETWLKAKIQDLANRLGRHRHRFARRPSPPGYWNPDFPSTQEIEKNKEEAERAERSLVEERWREAMRRGRWLFRDE